MKKDLWTYCGPEVFKFQSFGRWKFFLKNGCFNESSISFHQIHYQKLL